MEFYHLDVDTSFYSIDHKLSTFATDLWKVTQSAKLQITEITTVKLQSVSSTHARNPLLITALFPVNSATDIQLRRPLQSCSQNILGWYFSFAPFQSASFSVNRCQTWTKWGIKMWPTLTKPAVSCQNTFLRNRPINMSQINRKQRTFQEKY